MYWVNILKIFPRPFIQQFYFLFNFLKYLSVETVYFFCVFLWVQLRCNNPQFLQVILFKNTQSNLFYLWGLLLGLFVMLLPAVLFYLYFPLLTIAIISALLCNLLFVYNGCPCFFYFLSIVIFPFYILYWDVCTATTQW